MRWGLLAFFFLATGGASASPIVVSSPDGAVRFVFRVAGHGLPEYDVYFDGVQLVAHSPLALGFAGSDVFGRGLAIGHAALSEGADDYTLVVGKTSAVHDRYRQAVIPLIERVARGAAAKGGKATEGGYAKGRRIDFEVRVFNDGLAFRWTIPRQAGWSSFELTDEESSFRVMGNPLVLASFREGFTTSHEGLYAKQRFGELRADTLMDMPIFLDFDGGGARGGGGLTEGDRSKQGHIYAAITEARLLDYAGMYLIKHGDLLKSELSPLPGQPGGPVPSNGDAGAGAGVDQEPGTAADLESGRMTAIRVRATLPHSSPWRVLLIGKRAGALLESNILTDLNDPCAIKDPNWIKPGKTDFHWWNGDVVADTGFQPGINFETNQYYIDFCARNHIDYHTVIGYGGI